jgi:hypothetical protein
MNEMKRIKPMISWHLFLAKPVALAGEPKQETPDKPSCMYFEK